MKIKFLRIAMMAALLLAAITMGHAQNVPITVHEGWNWISYPKSEPMSVNEAFSGFTPMQGDMIKSESDGYALYRNGNWLGSLTTLYPGRGYHYQSVDGSTKTFIFGGAANDPSALPEVALDGEFTVDANGTKVRFSPGNLQCRVDPNQMSQITVGTGTSTTGYMPYYTYYNYSLCQMIYKADELHAAGLKAGLIKGIAFESYTTNYYMRNIKIWMSATSLTAAPSTSVTTSGMTQVFDGTVMQQTGWTEIDFSSSPFNWNGTSNLIVTVLMNHGSWDSQTYWRCNNAGFTCCNYRYNDDDAYAPNSSTYTMYTTTNRPNTRFKGSGGVVWRFAEHQTDYIGESNANISDTYVGWIDLFGWGTSGHPHGAVCYQPWSTSEVNDNYNAYGNATYNLYDQTGEADWGCNAISNGGNEPNQWRTLTKDEWNYVRYTRTTPSGIRYAKATVEGVTGLIVLPDNWQTSYYSLNNTNSYSASFSTNTFTSSQWSILEAHGVVFLPAAGRTNGSSVSQVGYYGEYWSSSYSSYNDNSCAYALYFSGAVCGVADDRVRGTRRSVRLVCQSNPRIRTLGVTNVTLNTATATAVVDYTGSGTVTERGVCWSTTVAPMASGSHATSGSGTGAYTVNLSSLNSGVTYHVRAYAIIGDITIYGNEMTFTTARQPSVNTSEVTNISTTYALCGGVVSECGQDVTARGLCWSQTNSSPTLSDSHSNEGTGTGSFTSIMTNLSTGTTYYVHAYATTAQGTVYGNVKSFTTIAPTGAINGKFSVSATQQVFFSRGNLQYQASTNNWRFATNQYDYIGEANSNLSSSYSGWIDLFGWGTSNYNHGAVCYKPWNISPLNSDYYAYARYDYNLYNQTGQADWGYNPISNGGNQENQWRTLTTDEWVYVFDTRTTSSGIRYAKAQVAGVNGMILLPDDWSSSYYNLSNTNIGEASFSSNVITSSQWSTYLEAHGAVFLPAAGYRYGTSVSDVGSIGYYYSASYYNNKYVYDMFFRDWDLHTDSDHGRMSGQSVRLVRNVE